MSNLYSYNDTMKMLGQQKVIASDSSEWQQINDIIDAFAANETHSVFKKIFELIKMGGFGSLFDSIYTLGVINGKREERARKKPLNSHQD